MPPYSSPCPLIPDLPSSPARPIVKGLSRPGGGCHQLVRLILRFPSPGGPVAAPATAPFRAHLSLSLSPRGPRPSLQRPPTTDATGRQLARIGPPWLPPRRPPGGPPRWRTVPASVPQSPRSHRREAPALARAATPVCPTPTAYCASLSASAANSLAGSGPVRLYTYSPAAL
ncbi:uncharacterized protein N7498_009086 [Penicillium cinerascens]|uniref:Uncharacterized protein n=1 Tax=Penicillium cinerascens TaxID=70096 RepID=A0A9W9JEZ3_9EURO|nr:uncharacterized protein N7498_009086 [Penicillium cinerascens]KAJ5195648.1 hypothetical protein N7498_009086 [Penicillium cinerascens]